VKTKANLAAAHSSPKKGEIPAPRAPEAFKESLPSLMSMAGDVPVMLRVLHLEFLKVIASALLQSLSESTEGNKRGVLSPNSHMTVHGGQFIH
jgi:hypothetical protein